MKTRPAASRCLSFSAAALLAAFSAGGCHGAHGFDTYLECHMHFVGEGASSSLAAEECDGELGVVHATEAECRAAHVPHVTEGVPEAIIDDHCTRLFPGSDGGA